MSVHLNITPLKPTEIPSSTDIIAAGKSIIFDVPSWKKGKHGKSYINNTVHTSSKPSAPNDGPPWFARTSTHGPKDATFDQFYDKLMKNKAENEMAYVPEVKKVALINQIADNQAIWTLHYRFSQPISPRVFTVLQTTHLQIDDSTGRRTALVISQPVDLSSDPGLAAKEEKGVKGRYVSVEEIQELEGNTVRWTMGTSSTPGGLIPGFLANSSMASTLSQDVPHFLDWLHKQSS